MEQIIKIWELRIWNWEFGVENSCVCAVELGIHMVWNLSYDDFISHKCSIWELMIQCMLYLQRDPLLGGGVDVRLIMLLKSNLIWA